MSSKKDNSMRPNVDVFDARLWARIQNSKQVQGLAWKIDQARGREGAGREIVKLLVEKWAEVLDLHRWYPDLKDVFNPDAIFCIEYAHRLQVGDKPVKELPWRVRYVLVTISNLVARHAPSDDEIKRRYNCEARRWEIAGELPLFDEPFDSEAFDRGELYVPPDATRTITVTNGYLCANDIMTGCTVEYHPAEEFNDGDLVVFTTEWADIVAAYLYHSKGKKFKYFSRRSSDDCYRKMYYDLIIHGIHASCGTPKQATGNRAKKGTTAREAIQFAENWPLFGLHKGDVLTVEKSGKAPVGKLVMLERDGDVLILRVCRADKDTVRVSGSDDGPEDVDRSTVIGPVVEIKHDGCEHSKLQAKIKDLHAKLERLGREDDQVIRCTARYKIEKEIYDLVHPLETPEEKEFSWPDEIDG